MHPHITDRDAVSEDGALGAPLDRRAFLRRAMLGGAALAGSSPIGLLSASASASGRRKRLSSPHHARRQPNILVIIADQFRTPRWFGAGPGPDGLPPNLARLRHGAVTFARHYTASSDCTPSRAALLTGLHTHQTGCMVTGQSTLDPAFPTWGGMLRDHGYQTYWFGKWHLTRHDGHWKAGNGGLELERYGFSGGTFPSPNGGPGQGARIDPQITLQFEELYSQTAGDGPWCTTVSFVNPHDVAWWYRWTDRIPGEGPSARSGGGLPPNFETPSQLSNRNKPLVQQSLLDTTAHTFGAVPYSGLAVERGWQPLLDLYVQLQRDVDVQIGNVLDTLATRPDVAANTVVLFTSDHGEYGASHGLRGKGASVYEEGINVPLIVRDPRGELSAEPSVVRHQISSSVDVAPLLLTIGSGSSDWRSEPRYAALAQRPQLERILTDPLAPGRDFALHATDEVVTEFALQPYAADAPLHIVGMRTPTEKYATYAHWRRNTVEPLSAGEQSELYDYSTRGGVLEVENLAGRHKREEAMRAALARAISDELHAPLPRSLAPARERGIHQALEIVKHVAHASQASRLHQLEQLVGSGGVPLA